MGQKIFIYGIRVDHIRNWDSKWYSEDGLYISDDLIHHSMQDRKIHLKKILGKRTYKKIISKVKSLSR